jgi:VWFA-related protein
MLPGMDVGPTMRLGCNPLLPASRFLQSLIYTSLLLATSAFAQGGQAEGTPTIRSTTRLVLVPTVVKDKSGRPVSGLKKEDFILQENGKPRQIAVFEEVRSGGDIRFQPLSAEGQPNQFSNRYQASPGARLRILALDTTSSDLINQQRSRDAMLKYLADSFDPGVPTALVVMRDNGLSLIYDFTTDPRALGAALKAVTTTTGRKDSGDPPAHGNTMAAAEMMQPNQTLTDPYLMNRLLAFSRDPDGIYKRLDQNRAVMATMENFRHLAHAYGGLPGRKELIWVTASFPFKFQDPYEIDEYDYSVVYRETFEALNNANIAVYPIDLKGLLVQLFPDISYCNSCGGEYKAFTGGAGLMGPETNNLNISAAEIASLETIANQTGGKAYYNRNDIEKSIGEAAGDTNEYYMLGFYAAPDADKKSEWRRLKVKTRDGSYKIRSRGGYFNRTSESESRVRNQDLRLAMVSDVAFTGVPLMIHFAGITDQGAKKRVRFEAILPPDTATIGTEGGEHIDLEFYGVVVDTGGKVFSSFKQPFAAKLNAQAITQVKTSGITYGSNLDLDPGQYRIRMVVRDNLNGKIGSVVAPLEVK